LSKAGSFTAAEPAATRVAKAAKAIARTFMALKVVVELLTEIVVDSRLEKKKWRRCGVEERGRKAGEQAPLWGMW
jgi:hypothetical protein